MEGAQTGFRMTENLSVQRTKSYCTDSRIRLGTGAHLRYVTFPFPASPYFSQEGTNQACVPSMSYNTAGAILCVTPNQEMALKMAREIILVVSINIVAVLIVICRAFSFIIFHDIPPQETENFFYLTPKYVFESRRNSLYLICKG